MERVTLVPSRMSRSLAPAFLGVLVFAVAARAQLSLSPVIIEQRAYPGGLRQFTLSVSNTGKEPLDCQMTVYAMRVMGGGLPTPVDEAPRSCKDWITVEQNKFTLGPRTGKKIVCRVRVPKADVAGGYYALLSCEGTPRGAASAPGKRPGVTAGIRFSYRVMVPVLLTVPAPDMKAVIDVGKPMVSLAKSRKGYKIDLPVRNRGNVHMRIEGFIEVRSEAGQLVERFDLKAGRGFVLPMHERLFTSRGHVNLPDGGYVANAQFRAKEARRPMRVAFPFYVQDGKPVVAEMTDELRAKLAKEAAGFTVSPPQLGVRLRAGARRTEAIELANMTRHTLRLRATVLEWERAPDGTDLVVTRKPSHHRSALGLLSLRQSEIELRPLARQRVPLLISLPKGATGERYAAVTFDRADLVLDASPKARARRSALLGVHALATGTYEVKIAQFEALRRPNGSVRLVLKIKNSGDLSVTPEATFYIINERDVRIGKTGPATRPPFILAGGEGVVSAEWTKVLDPGEYTTTASLRYSPKDPPLSARAKFTVPKPTAEKTPPKAGAEAVQKKGETP